MTSPFSRLFDDAAVFPPGDAPVDVAVKQHVARAAAPEGAYVGPFVCDVARLPALVGTGAALDVSLVGAAGEIGPALDSLTGSPVRVVSVEVRGPVEAPPDVTVPVAVEMPWGTGFTVPPGALLKLRCGGAHVPSADELGDAISHCVRHDQPFKLTAGLHAAVAHEGAHGFVNVMAAVVATQRGQDPAPVLRADADGLDLASLRESRRLFRSVGTCSIDEPLAGLRALGLLP
ncbi:hypothetical protein [Aeromicrobium sp. 179-A 4D2 NHS]|uniref:hypothetical protein n=1 Tax=Aeromicrobium sp. 179-A 4D2 NHS TaxID=3142375 RepID=UPI00399F4364